MKFYTLRTEYVDGFNVYRSVLDDLCEGVLHTHAEKIARGEPLRMRWFDALGRKPEGDWIGMQDLVIAGSAGMIEPLAKFAPSAQVTPFTIRDDERRFALLRPKNFSADATCIDHAFLMFKTHKSVLVTEQFKEEWERQRRTGAVFALAGELQDSRFHTMSQKAC